MGVRNGSVRLALCASLMGTASAWALSPHDKAVGVPAAQLGNNQADKGRSTQSQSNPAQNKSATASAVENTKAARERKEDRQDKLRGDTIAGVIGFITFCVLIVQTRVFGKQAQSLRDTIAAMQNIGTKQSEDMRSSIVAAQAAAEAGNRSADLARLALEVSERAWLKVDILIKMPIRNEFGGIQIEIRYIMHNVGKTPAFNVKPSLEIINLAMVMPKSRQSQYADALLSEIGDFGDVVWPGDFLKRDSTLACDANFLINITDNSAVASQAFLAAVVGTVQYKTNFGVLKETGFIRDLGLLAIDQPVRLIFPHKEKSLDDGFVMLPRMFMDGRIT